MGLASVLTVARYDFQIEVGMIGREGVTGLAVLMGNDCSPFSVFMQSPAKAIAFEVADPSQAHGAEP